MANINIDEKVNRLEKEILADVEAEKAAILKELQDEIDRIYNEKETEYLTVAYNIIQNGMKMIDKQKHETMSKTIMESKAMLLNKRSEIIEAVFAKAEEKLRDFVQSNDYYPFLVNMIENCLNEATDGEHIVYINSSDEKYLDDLNKKFGNIVVTENNKIDMIGGCKVLNKTLGIFIDDSFAKRLKDEHGPFLQRCKITIE